MGVQRPEIVRRPAVAGVFYPQSPEELARSVDALIEGAEAKPLEGKLTGLICPHAGYIYSGPIAATGYRLLRGRRYQRVVVMSPSHRVAFRGLALPDCTAFDTPLGRIPVWSGCGDLLRERPFVLDSRPHAMEHAIEVHLPFLQRTLGEFELVPIVFGASERLVDFTPLLSLVNPETLFVVSTDLSHYLPYQRARDTDQATLRVFLSRDAEAAVDCEACGSGPTATMLGLARHLDWSIDLLDYRNSGDTAGDKSRVVGYAALALMATAPSPAHAH